MIVFCAENFILTIIKKKIEKNRFYSNKPNHTMSCQSLFIKNASETAKKATTFKQLFLIMTPEAQKTIFCLASVFAQAMDAFEQGQSSGLSLSSKTLQSANHLAGGSQAPIIPIIDIQEFEKCIESKIPADKNITADVLDAIVVDCVGVYCPGVKKMSSCIKCLSGAVLKYKNLNPTDITPDVEAKIVSDIVSMCAYPSGVKGYWYNLPEWARIAIIALAAIAIIAIIAKIFMKPKNTIVYAPRNL